MLGSEVCWGTTLLPHEVKFNISKQCLLGVYTGHYAKPLGCILSSHWTSWDSVISSVYTKKGRPRGQGKCHRKEVWAQLKFNSLLLRLKLLHYLVSVYCMHVQTIAELPLIIIMSMKSKFKRKNLSLLFFNKRLSDDIIPSVTFSVQILRGEYGNFLR